MVDGSASYSVAKWETEKEILSVAKTVAWMVFEKDLIVVALKVGHLADQMVNSACCLVDLLDRYWAEKLGEYSVVMKA